MDDKTVKTMPLTCPAGHVIGDVIRDEEGKYCYCRYMDGVLGKPVITQPDESAPAKTMYWKWIKGMVFTCPAPDCGKEFQFNPAKNRNGTAKGVDNRDRIRENYYRRMAARLGLALRKSRGKLWSIDNQLGYQLFDAIHNTLIIGEKFEMSLDRVAEYLEECERKLHEAH